MEEQERKQLEKKKLKNKKTMRGKSIKERKSMRMNPIHHEGRVEAGGRGLEEVIRISEERASSIFSLEDS